MIHRLEHDHGRRCAHGSCAGNANDLEIILQSIDGVVPTNTRLEQLP